LRTVCIARVHKANSDSRWASVASMISRRSCPAENAVPAARRMTHFTWPSASAASRHPINCSSAIRESTFRFSGLLSVIRAISPSRS